MKPHYGGAFFWTVMEIKQYKTDDEIFPDAPNGLRSFSGNFRGSYRDQYYEGQGFVTSIESVSEHDLDYSVRSVTTGKLDSNGSGFILQILAGEQMPWCRKIKKLVEVDDEGFGYETAGVEIHFVGQIECESGIRRIIDVLQKTLEVMESK